MISKFLRCCQYKVVNFQEEQFHNTMKFVAASLRAYLTFSVMTCGVISWQTWHKSLGKCNTISKVTWCCL